MRKSVKTILICLLAVSMGGCQSIGGKPVELMDFQADMEWKVPEPAAKKQPKILFVGNSYIFYNNLSGMFVQIADSFGHGDEVYEVSKGYYSLKQYADPEDQAGATLDKVLKTRKWDFVVLQENTKQALSSDAEEEMFQYARILDEKIRASGGQTAFLMTWAPENGTKNGLKKQSCQELQSILAQNYITIADELNSLLIPAGIGFMRCSAQYPEIQLWDSDGQHPSPAGTYLAACTAYAVVFQESPERCPFTGNLDQELASKLQKIAAELVLD